MEKEVGRELQLYCGGGGIEPVKDFLICLSQQAPRQRQSQQAKWAGAQRWTLKLGQFQEYHHTEAGQKFLEQGGGFWHLRWRILTPLFFEHFEQIETAQKF